VGDVFGKDYTFQQVIMSEILLKQKWHSHPDENPFWPSGFNNHGKDSNPTFTLAYLGMIENHQVLLIIMFLVNICTI
jgi:hypothetical protein